MKNISLLLILSLFISLLNCGDNTSKKEEKKIKLQKTEKKVKETLTGDSELIALGKKLFSEKTCATCHHANSNNIGPSIKDINAVYAKENADLITFLKGELTPIVDTNPTQVAIMKANLDGFVKDLKDNELHAIKAYMLSFK